MPAAPAIGNISPLSFAATGAAACRAGVVATSGVGACGTAAGAGGVAGVSVRPLTVGIGARAAGSDVGRLTAGVRAGAAWVPARAWGGEGVSTMAAGAGKAITGVLATTDEAVGAAGCTCTGTADPPTASPGVCCSVGGALSRAGETAEPVSPEFGTSMAGGAIFSVGTSCASEGVADRASTAAIAAKPGRAGLIAYLMTR